MTKTCKELMREFHRILQAHKMKMCEIFTPLEEARGNVASCKSTLVMTSTINTNEIEGIHNAWEDKHFPWRLKQLVGNISQSESLANITFARSKEKDMTRIVKGLGQTLFQLLLVQETSLDKRMPQEVGFKTIPHESSLEDKG